MNPNDSQVEIAGCILDHFEFCTDHPSAANCAAQEIVTKMRRGWFGPCSENYEAGLAHCAKILHCEPTFTAIAEAIKELDGQVSRAKRMIADLRRRNDRDDSETLRAVRQYVRGEAEGRYQRWAGEPNTYVQGRLHEAREILNNIDILCDTRVTGGES